MICDRLAEILKASYAVKADGGRIITTGYAGDFLSFVMGRAPEGGAWFTVMSNVNVAAVAVLTGVSAVILCEGVKAEQALKDRCQREGINLLETELDIFSAVKEFVKNED